MTKTSSSCAVLGQGASWVRLARGIALGGGWDGDREVQAADLPGDALRGAKFQLQPIHTLIKNVKDLMEKQLFLQNMFSLHASWVFFP